MNEAPTALSFANTVTAIDENVTVGTGIKVADVVVTDDALGSETLTLSGADSAFFELRGSELYFIGASPDFETKASYAVTVEADDPTVGGAIDTQATFTLGINDLFESAPPVITGATNGTVQRDVSLQIPPDAITNGGFEQGLNNSPPDLPGWSFGGHGVPARHQPAFGRRRARTSCSSAGSTADPVGLDRRGRPLQARFLAAQLRHPDPDPTTSRSAGMGPSSTTTPTCRATSTHPGSSTATSWSAPADRWT